MLARMKSLLAIALLLVTASPASAAGASNFTLVNGTGAPLAELSIRRAGTQEWKALGPAPSAGARMQVKFVDPDCAFDIQAKMPGAGPVTWAGGSGASMPLPIRAMRSGAPPPPSSSIWRNI